MPANTASHESRRKVPDTPHSARIPPNRSSSQFLVARFFAARRMREAKSWASVRRRAGRRASSPCLQSLNSSQGAGVRTVAATPGDEQLAVDVCRAAASASLFSTLRVGNARAVALPDPTSSASGDWDSRLLEVLKQHVVAQQLRRLPSYRSSDGKRAVDS